MIYGQAPVLPHRSIVRRDFSVPERLGGFGLAVAAAAVVWPAVAARGGGLPCPLRLFTGCPCPACGLTTAAVALVRGHVGEAVAANPAIVGLAACALVVVPLVALRAAGLVRPPRPWPAAWRRRTEWVAGLLGAASWFYQLHRLGVG
jgi:hypothetical protein